jgi:hypothetical protein
MAAAKLDRPLFKNGKQSLNAFAGGVAWFAAAGA